MWNEDNKTWEEVTDGTIWQVLELGFNPNRTYEIERWSGKNYLVDQYNGARIAEETESGWKKVTDASEIYHRYLQD